MAAMRALLLAPILVLSTCTAPSSGPAGPPPSAIGATFALPMRLVGTEPFWGATITADSISLSGADRPHLRFPAGGREVTGAGVRWRTQTSAGDPVEVTLLRETCSDGMSDRSYPFHATVVIGSETLSGCAMTESEFMRPPRP